MNHPLLTRLRDFFSLNRSTLSEEFDPFLLSYYRKLYKNPREVESFIEWCGKLARYAGAEGGTLLDCGCGFGITCFGFVASDHPPKKVIGLDPSRHKIEVMTKIARFLNVAEDRVQPIEGSALELQFNDGSFDSVFVKDVASHVIDRPRFFGECARVLKPGGKFLLTDENNALNIITWRARKRIWTENEIGPLPSNSWLDRPYREQRKHMISEWHPELPPNIVDQLAEKSMGMYGDPLKQAVTAYLDTGHFDNTSDFPYRHPISGEYLEYPFNPFRLAADLSAFGLTAKVLPPVFHTSHPLKKFAASLISSLHPASIIIQPSFYILGAKN